MINNALKINSENQRGKYLPWIIFGAGILYYCFAYLLRVYPSVMEHHLLSHFNVSIKDFGFITGFYYFAYAPMQLPVGVTVDRIGARRALLIGCVIATGGALIFASTTIVNFALLGRFLIGLGAAFGYVTALKIASIWLPKRIFATAIGFVTGAGMLAAIATDNYLTHLMHVTDFYSVLLVPVYVGLGLFIIIFLFVKDKKNMNGNDDQAVSRTTSYKELGRQLWGVIKKPQMWLIGIVGALLYLPSSVFVDAWAIPFLRSVRHLTASQGAFAASLTLAGWIISSFISGYLSDRFHTRKIPLLIAACGATVISSILIFAPLHHISTIYFLLFSLGIFCGPHPLCFSLSKENCPLAVSGTAVAFANFLIMSGGMILQPVVGDMLQHIDKLASHAGVAQYTSHDFSIALSVIPIGLFIATCLTFFIKETFGKQGL